ncbi:hypothetical protein BTZ20_2227 [Rhodococcus sp. MTM3W5.2]|nr:hypothetical protein BTZ20_2227 [Rhodococcus sp. MTM3W5.2]
MCERLEVSIRSVRGALPVLELAGLVGPTGRGGSCAGDAVT